MLDLARQVQVATDQARRGAARLAGAEPPSYEDNETTIDQLKERLTKTLAYLKTLDGKQIDAAADREIAFPLGGGHTGRMQGSDYLNHFVLPNFYFHVTAAYAILRHCGVEIGKRDFFGCDSDKENLRTLAADAKNGLTCRSAFVLRRATYAARFKARSGSRPPMLIPLRQRRSALIIDLSDASAAAVDQEISEFGMVARRLPT
jgi:hypothetical protein